MDGDVRWRVGGGLVCRKGEDGCAKGAIWPDPLVMWLSCGGGATRRMGAKVRM